GPRQQEEDVVRGRKRGGALEPRSADRVELRVVAPRVAEHHDDTPGRHDRRCRSQRKKRSVPTTVSPSLTAFLPWSFDSPCSRSRMCTATSSTRSPAAFSRSSAST